MELRPYQIKTIEMIRQALRHGAKNVLCALPTGSGKSVIMGHIARMAAEKGNKTLALMHRRQLVKQLQERFEDCGVSSTLVMSGEKTSFNADCRIGTIQTYSRRIELNEDSYWGDVSTRPWFHDADICLIDECHRSLSRTFQQVLGQYPNKIIIGFTATPTLSSGVGMGEFYDALIQPVSVQELIDAGNLVPARYYGLSAPDLSKIRTVAGDYEKAGLGKAVNTQELIGDIVDNWARIAQGKKTIVFAVNVKHSKALCHEFKKYDIAAAHLDAHAKEDKRQEVLDRFRAGDLRVLCNVDLYTEGTDIPDIECIVLARPTKSIGRYLQMVGRGSRPAPGKKDVLILDHGTNVNRHGFYEDEICWTLKGKKITLEKKEQEPRKKHKMECRECSCLFTGDRCPMCHTVVPDYGKKIEAIEAELQELKDAKKEKGSALKSYPAELLTGMLKHEAHRLNKTDSWIRANFRNITGKWPRFIHTAKPVPADDNVKNMLKHYRIKWIKSQQRKQPGYQTKWGNRFKRAFGNNRSNGKVAQCTLPLRD